jgi:hypothetical protein
VKGKEDHQMATIETNQGEAVGLTIEEAIIDQVLRIVRTRPAAVVDERGPVGTAPCPTTTSSTASPSTSGR